MDSFQLPLSSKCIKYLLFTFNLLFLLSGIIMLIIGSAILSMYHEYQHFLDNRFFSVPSLLIAIGSIIFFIAFFGCCGAIKENYCLIIVFAALMVIVFIMEFAAGITGYVMRNSVGEALQSKMIDTTNKYNTSLEIRQVWDLIQRDFRCCGVNKPEDWEARISNKTERALDLPLSCCKPGVSGACKLNGTLEFDFSANDNLTYWNVGCIESMTGFAKEHALQLGGAGLGLAFVQAVGIWFAVYLARAIKRNYHGMP
ncbi:hypothetical protein TKK_0008842 [Trichogramma kaykai]|uniref:Tetraspanin n=1 Tax=Trichogramma kaykai TaxID=54128 RepID=A0ABD2X302_9HYME